jgi:2-C-methyl-D-erythritol 2,4-cyclodiphosphate synthase
MEMLKEDEFKVVNADITVIAEQPRIQPYARAMEERIAGLLGVTVRDVCVKGKTNEGMGWIGRKEGLAVIATVLINRNRKPDTPDVTRQDC